MEFSVYLVWEKKHSGFYGVEDRSHIIFSAQSLSELCLHGGLLIDDDNLPSEYNLDFKMKVTLLHRLPSYCPRW